jgi:hypothetical protein
VRGAQVTSHPDEQFAWVWLKFTVQNSGLFKPASPGSSPGRRAIKPLSSRGLTAGSSDTRFLPGSLGTAVAHKDVRGRAKQDARADLSRGMTMIEYL